MNILNNMWAYSNAAYFEPKDRFELEAMEYIDTKIQRADTFIYQQNSIDFTFIAEYDEDIIASFRGTDNVKGLISDLGVYPLKESKTIHNEFYDSWVAFKQFYDDHIRNFINKKLFITGHSRGAALAILCARHLAKNRGIRGISVIVFGCPRIGNKTFRDEYNKLHIETTRIENGYDLVTLVPPRTVGFRHVGKSHKLKKPFYHRWFFRIRDHHMPSYKKSLIKK